jgi:hypothetical protein
VLHTAWAIDRGGFAAAREEVAHLYGALGRRREELEQLQLIAMLDRSHAFGGLNLIVHQQRAAVRCHHVARGVGCGRHPLERFERFPQEHTIVAPAAAKTALPYV